MKLAACVVAVLGLLSAPAAAAPSDVNAQVFYANAIALQKKGMGAMLDKRLRPMMSQMKDAGTRVQAANTAAKAAGRPLYCVPEGTKRSRSAQEVIAMLGRVPEAERRAATLRDVWQRVLVREYPCR